MNRLIIILLFISIVSGQLIKFSVDGFSGPNLLDITIIFLCIVGLFQIKGKLHKPNRIIISALAFSLICGMSILLTPLQLSLNEYLVSASYIVRFFSFVFFVWIINSGGLKILQRKMIDIFFYAILAIAILGLLQLIFIPNLMFLTPSGWDPHYFRTVSTFLDPNFLGAFLTIGLLLLASKQVLIPSQLQRIFFIIIYLSFITTFSRGSALMMASSFLTLSFLLRSFKMFTLTAILSLGFAVSFFAYTTVISTPRNISREQSAEHRVDAWEQGVIVFQTYPILGVGFNTYKYALNQLNLINPTYNSRGLTTNDSSLIYVLSTTGVIGISFYLYFLGNIIYYSFINFKKDNILSAVFLSSTIGLIFHSFFSNTLFYPFLLFWILLSSIIKFKENKHL